MADGRHLEKPKKSQYLSNRLTNFDEILHGDAYWPLESCQSIKLLMLVEKIITSDVICIDL